MPIDADISTMLREAASRWIASAARPLVNEATLAYWDALVEAWAADPTMPVLVRKTGSKGVPVAHPDGGREN